MKKTTPLIILFFLFSKFISFAQIKFCSWNIQNFGKSKTESHIKFIAKTLNGFDVVAIVEVVAGLGGSQAVARLADELNRNGSKWDYSISDPTTGSPSKSERYAFLWKTSKLKKIGAAFLENKYQIEIEREPYLATFSSGNKEFTIATFHALPKNKQPEQEIKYLKFIPGEFLSKNIIFSGDFNCPESHTVFNPLKVSGYLSAFTKQKTSLKTKCVNNDCLASEYDNIFYKGSKINLIKSGVVHFYKEFSILKEARKISDHLPVYLEFSIN